MGDREGRKTFEGWRYIRQMSRRKSYWIYKAKVLPPNGLNIDFDLNFFISNA